MDDQTNLTSLARALGLPEDASLEDMIGRATALREQLGEEDIEDMSVRERIIRGEHERVTITPTGAVVTLYFPLKSGKEEIAELTLRRPQAKELRDFDESKSGNIAKSLKMIAACSRRSPAELDAMDAADTLLVSTVVGFLQRPPRRTGTSS